VLAFGVLTAYPINDFMHAGYMSDPGLLTDATAVAASAVECTSEGGWLRGLSVLLAQALPQCDQG